MRNECNIIRDILPLYVEDMVSDDTADFVEKHLEKCDACRAELENMKTPNKIDKTCENVSTASGNEAIPMRIIKKKLWLRAIILVLIAICVTIAVIKIFDIASKPDGTTDTPELGEITRYTQEQLDERLIGLMREEVYHSWGKPDGIHSDFWGDYWYLDENNTAKITVHYGDDGLIEDIDIELIE